MGRLLVAELLKLKRQWASALTFIAPISQACFLFLFYWFLEDRANPHGDGFFTWYQTQGIAWNLFFMPITVALIATLTWDMEAMAGRGKHLFVQPYSRQAHFFAKTMSHFLMMLVATLTLALFVFSGGLLLKRYVPTLDMGNPDLAHLLRLTMISILGTSPLIILHTWIPIRLSGMVGNLVIALGGSWGTLQLAENHPAVSAWSPWGMASQATSFALEGKAGFFKFLLGCLGITLLLLVATTLDFRRRDTPFND